MSNASVIKIIWVELVDYYEPNNCLLLHFLEHWYNHK